VFEAAKETNVFVIMRYRPGAAFKAIEHTIKTTLDRYGLKAVLAKDFQFEDQLWPNIEYCMTHSRYGIVVVENIDERSPKSSYFNPNVAIELGYMLALKNRCLILKERAVRTLNTDILQFIYTPFDKFDVRDTVEAAISRWLENLSVFPTRPIEIISSDNALEAKKQRTQRINGALTNMLQDDNAVLRHAGSLSSLAISEKESLLPTEDRALRSLLLDEKRLMERLIEKGAIVRCIITPDVQLVNVDLNVVSKEIVETSVIPRFETLLETLKKCLHKENVQFVYTSRGSHDNVVIDNERQVFIGARRLREWGFSSTTVIHDPVVVRNEIKQFDIAYKEVAEAILLKNDLSADEFGCQELKLKVIDHLKYCKKRLREAAARIGKGGQASGVPGAA